MARTVRFDCFELDLEAHRLFKRGARIRLREQSFQVLALLLARAGQVVTREELRSRLWTSHTFVDFENNLNTTVGRLREALGDSADRPRYIETLPRLGYRFLGNVAEGSALGMRANCWTAKLLVLPFVNTSGDPSQEYISDAVTDEIIAELSSLAPAGLGVIARTTAMHYKGRPDDVADIARSLALDWIVEGSVRRMDNRVALTVQLIRASDQTHVLARRYEAPVGDIFDVERTVARTIGQEIGVSTERLQDGSGAPSGARSSRKPTQDLVAYNCYIQGRHHLEAGVTPRSWVDARACVEAAVARDPHFALAHDALAELWWTTGLFGIVAPKEALAVGLPHAVQAVELEPGLADAHAMLAQYRKQLEFDWSEVTREMALALELDPASPEVRRRRAITGLMPFGRLDEAIRDLEVAIDLDPLDVFSHAWLVVMYWLGRKYDRGAEHSRLLLEIAPTHFFSHFSKGLILTAMRHYPEAIAALRHAVDLTGGGPLFLGWLGLAIAESGDVAGARGIYERLRAMPARVYVPPTSYAWIHVGLGEVDEFFAWMHRAIDGRDHMITPIQSYPFLDGVRKDPRYGELLGKMKLA